MLMTFQTFQDSIGNNHRGVILKPYYIYERRYIYEKTKLLENYWL